MKKRTIPIGVFLIVISIILVVLPAISIWFMNTVTITNDTVGRFHEQLDLASMQAHTLILDTFERGQEKVNSDLILADYVLNSYGRPWLDQNETIEMEAVDQISKESKNLSIPVMRTGSDVVSGDFTIVDNIKNLVGGTATIFQVIPDGLLRISTNVMKLDGQRAVGTYIPTTSGVYKTVMNGDTFYGRAYVVNAWYMTAYKPFFDDNNGIIGVIYVGVKEDFYKRKILDQLVDIEVGKSGYLFILDSEGNYILSDNNNLDGVNILDTADANGVPVVRELIELTKSAEEGVTAEYDYLWTAPGETKPREKFSGSMYFEPWDWIVVTSAYRDDVYEIISANTKRTTILGGIALLLGIATALIMSRRISRPLKRMGRVVEQISHKDLSEPEDIRTTFREFSVLIENISRELLPSLHRVFKSIENLVENGLVVSENLDGSSSQTGQVATDIVKKSDALLKQLENLDVQITDAGSSVSHINDTLADLADKLETQSTAVSQTSSAIEEMAASINTVARIAREKQSASQSLVRITADGSEKVNNNNASIRKISDSIGDILDLTKVINGIAAQTNLLAMNAAIEAAHAGDAGKGFAVVADEIRKLSASTTDNSKSISTTLSNVVRHIEETSDSSRILLGSFEEISSEIRNFVDAFVEITNSTAEISSGSDEMVNAVDELNTSTHEIMELSRNIRTDVDGIKYSLKTIKSVSFNTVEAFNLVGDGTREIQAANEHVRRLSQENRDNLDELKNEVRLFKLQ